MALGGDEGKGGLPSRQAGPQPAGNKEEPEDQAEIDYAREDLVPESQECGHVPGNVGKPPDAEPGAGPEKGFLPAGPVPGAEQDKGACKRNNDLEIVAEGKEEIGREDDDQEGKNDCSRNNGNKKTRE